MIKKNRHRAGRKKRERILRAQQRATLETQESRNITRPIIRVAPRTRELTEPETRGPAVPLIDLTDENTIPLIDLFQDDTHHRDSDLIDIGGDSDIEILNSELSTSPDVHNENPPALEPLDPDTEYRQNISRIFINLDRYARSVFDNLPLE